MVRQVSRFPAIYLELRPETSCHSSQLLAQLAALRDDSQLCDVVLVIKVILTRVSCIVSQFFKRNRIGRSGTNDASCCLVNFCYSGRLEINDANVLNMLHAASVLQLDKVQVFTAVTHWVKFNLTERKSYLSKLLEHVRLPLCSPKFLVGTVGEDPLLSDDTACQELVNEAKNHLLLQLATLEHSKLQGPRIRPRKVLSGEVLYA
ncbi:BTB And Kelch, partial [Ostertagia ostertagi]